MTKKLKTLHIITGLSTGGAERALYNILQGGLADRFDNHIISLSNMGTIGRQIEALGVPVTALGMRPGRPTPSGLLRLRKVVGRLQPDLIQGWMYHGNLAATLARYACSVKPALLWNIRHSLYEIKDEKPLTRLVIRVNRFFSNAPDALLYNSRVARKQHEAFGFASFSGQVIPNGINCQQFAPSREPWQRVREELAIPSDALLVGHVARFHPMKDHANFLQAASMVARNFPNVHFLLTGRDITMDNLEITQHIPVDEQHRFHLLGERRDVPDLMSAMDVLSSSSRGEGFPNVLGEAMAVGVPCVATDVGDSAYIIGDCGVVVKPRDPKALASGIESLLALSISEREALGRQARVHIEKNFALAAIVARYATLYEELIFDRREIRCAA